MTSVKLVSSLCLSAVLAIGAIDSAQARHIAIDFGQNGNTGNDFGSSAAVAQELDITNDRSSGAIDLGFSIDFGLGAVSTLFINENGIVSFGAPLAEPFSGAATLASLVGGAGQPSGVIAPYYANLTSVPGDGDLFSNGAGATGEIFYQRGAADLTINPVTNTYDFDDETPAFRVTWNGLQGLGTPVFSQLYLYSLGAPDSFRIAFAYGADGEGDTPAQGSIAGFALGSSITQFTGPYGAESDFIFNFTGGGTPPTGVPEPPVSALLAGALLALVLVRRRSAQRAG